MTTKIIGIKEFRQNMSKLAKQSQAKNIRFIVMNHSRPVMEMKPIMDEDDLIDELMLEKYADKIEKAWQQSESGKGYTPEEVRKMLKLEK